MCWGGGGGDVVCFIQNRRKGKVEKERKGLALQRAPFGFGGNFQMRERCSCASLKQTVHFISFSHFSSLFILSIHHNKSIPLIITSYIQWKSVINVNANRYSKEIL